MTPVIIVACVVIGAMIFEAVDVRRRNAERRERDRLHGR